MLYSFFTGLIHATCSDRVFLLDRIVVYLLDLIFALLVYLIVIFLLDLIVVFLFGLIVVKYCTKRKYRECLRPSFSLPSCGSFALMFKHSHQRLFLQSVFSAQ